MADPQTFTQEQVDALIAERLAAETAGLIKNRDEVLKESKAAKARLAALEGIDPEEFKTLKAAQTEAARKKAADEGNFQSLEKQLKDLHAQEIGKEQSRSTKLQKALEQRLVQAELTAAIAKHKGDPDYVLHHAAKLVRVRELEDDFEAFVADEQGNPRIADGKGTPMSFDDLVTQVLIPKYPRAFDGTGSSGGGASKSTGGAGGARVISRDDGKGFLDNLEGIASGKVEVRA